jgi:hypothetical protein
MTSQTNIIRPKLGLLELAKQLGNVSQACKIMGHSRDTFYRRKKPLLKNRVPDLWPAEGLQRTQKAGHYDLTRRSALSMAASRPGNPEGFGS